MFKRSKKLNKSNILRATKNLKNITIQDHYINQKSLLDRSFNQSKSDTKSALILDTSPDPNYNEIEKFILDHINRGFDPVDVLILARETFDNERLDLYLYEMREKGII